MYPGWVWHAVVPILELAGHDAIPVDLPGTEPHSSLAPKDITLQLWIDHIAGLAARCRTRVILVGHSRGGHLIGEVAERNPELIAGLIYVTAALSTPGQTMFATISAGQPEIMPVPEGDSFRVPDDYAANLLLDRCNPSIRSEAISRLYAEPLGPGKTPSNVTWERWGRVPRAFVECSADRSLTLQRQRAMQAATPCQEVMTIDADHSPFLSNPQALAASLLELEQRFRSTASAASPSGSDQGSPERSTSDIG